MDDLNKNMEEFFRKSLDQFDQEPSKEIWTQLEERMDDDNAGAAGSTNSSNWWRSILPLLLLLGLLGSFGLNNYWKNQEIDSLRDQLTVIEKEQADLKSALTLASQNSSAVTFEKPLTESATFESTNAEANSEPFKNRLSAETAKSVVSSVRVDTFERVKYITKYVYVDRPIVGSSAPTALSEPKLLSTNSPTQAFTGLQ